MSYHCEITREGVMEAEPLAFDRPRITVSTTVTYRGRALVVSAEGLDADRFCDLLDKRFGKTDDAPIFTPRSGAVSDTTELPPPRCPVHQKPMRPMKFADRLGHTFMCPTKLADGEWCQEKA